MNFDFVQIYTWMLVLHCTFDRANRTIYIDCDDGSRVRFRISDYGMYTSTSISALFDRFGL
jgi:hypothetical protein